MKDLNSNLLELIETELRQSTQSNYYKNISINEYNLETKLTLDFLVEKYGGFIYRHDNRITLFINFSNFTPKDQAKINRKLFSKVTELEYKLSQLSDFMEKMSLDKNKNFFSYMDYFKQVDDIKHDTKNMKNLIDDVMKNEKV